MWMIWVGVAAVAWVVLYVVWSVVGGITTWLSDKRAGRLRDYLRDELTF